MSVSVTMPQLGESVTEGTVTRWLKKEGERVEADEPLLEVSTDKVDTEIPSPVAGLLRGITVAEDETVEVGAELAVIDENGAAAPAESDEGAETTGPGRAAVPPAPAESPADDYSPGAQQPDLEPAAEPVPIPRRPGTSMRVTSRPPFTSGPPPTRRSATGRRARRTPRASRSRPPRRRPDQGQPGSAPQEPAVAGGASVSDIWQRTQPASTPPTPSAPAALAPAAAAPQAPAPPASPQPGANGPARLVFPLGTADGPYVTPLVRKLAAEHGVDLATVAGTGVGGRIRKQDVIDAARVRREAIAAAQQSAADGQAAAAQAPAGQAPAGPAQGSSRRLSTVASPAAFERRDLAGVGGDPGDVEGRPQAFDQIGILLEHEHVVPAVLEVRRRWTCRHCPRRRWRPS